MSEILGLGIVFFLCLVAVCLWRKLFREIDRQGKWWLQ